MIATQKRQSLNSCCLEGTLLVTALTRPFALAAATSCLDTGSRPFGAIERMPSSWNLDHSLFQSTALCGMSCSSLLLPDSASSSSAGGGGPAAAHTGRTRHRRDRGIRRHTALLDSRWDGRKVDGVAKHGCIVARGGEAKEDATMRMTTVAASFP